MLYPLLIPFTYIHFLFHLFIMSRSLISSLVCSQRSGFFSRMCLIRTDRNGWNEGWYSLCCIFFEFFIFFCMCCCCRCCWRIVFIPTLCIIFNAMYYFGYVQYTLEWNCIFKYIKSMGGCFENGWDAFHPIMYLLLAHNFKLIPNWFIYPFIHIMLGMERNIQLNSEFSGCLWLLPSRSFFLFHHHHHQHPLTVPYYR